MIERSNWLKITIGLLLIVLLMSCSFLMFSNRVKAEEEKTEIKFWWFGGKVRAPTMEKIIGRFEEAHPNIEVDAQMFSGWEDLHQKSLLAIAGGNPPDVTIVKPMNLADLADRGSLLQLDDYIEKDNIDTDQWLDIVYEYDSKWEGNTYALPWNMAAFTLLYNKDRFEEAGLDPDSPPETWEELLEYAKKLTDSSKRQYGLLAPYHYNGFLMFLKQNGGDFLADDYSEALMNSPEGVEALQFLIDAIYKHNVSPKPGETDEVDLYNERIAMWYDHNGSLPNFAKFAPDMNLASARNPKKETTTTIEMSSVMSIFAASEHPDEAWELIKWFCENDEMQMLWSEEIGHLPVVKELINQPPFTTEPKYQGFQEQVMTSMWARPVAPRALEMVQSLNSEVESAFLQEKTAQEALDDAYDEIMEIIRKIK